MANKHNSRKAEQLVRGISLVISLVLITWAIYGGDLIGGGPGFGWAQGAVLTGGILLAFSCVARFNWCAGVLAVYISVGLTLIICELVLRWFVGPRYFGVFQLDDYYLYKLIPNTTREYNRQAINKEGRHVYRINSDGFRGEELIYGRDIKRIVVYGDSFIHAEFSILEDSFTEQLEGILSHQLGQEVEVVNAGVAGYGPDQIARRMEHELSWLKPDLVIVGVFAGNDFGDLIRNKLYRLDDNGELQENEFIVGEEVQHKMALARGELLLKKILRDVGRGLLRRQPEGRDDWIQSGNKRVDYYFEQNSREFREFIGEGDNTVKVLASDPYNADVSLTPNSDSAVYKRRLMSRIIEKINGIAREEGIPLVLLIIPHPMDVLDGVHDSGEVDRQRFPEYSPAVLTDILYRIGDDNQIPLVNLFEPYQKQDAAQFYFSGGDDHWNELGQAVAADEVARFLISGNLIPR